MKPVDRAIALGAILAVVILGFVVVPQIGELDQDDALINRGQQVNTCIGDRQDAIDKWRAVATFEFTHQVQRSVMGLPIDTRLAERAEEAIYELVEAKQAIRAEQLALIDSDGPVVEFVCPDIPADLIPPPL